MASSHSSEPKEIDLEAARANFSSPQRVQSPIVKTASLSRPRRSRTALSYQPRTRGRLWKPGQEPGIDPSAAHHAPEGLEAECGITVVDFSQDSVEVQDYDNETLAEFLDQPRDGNAVCRWINVNGLSWDVISLIGKKRGFHRLAIEDMINRRNRTKADWYADHTYMVLPLQRLVHCHKEDASDCEGSEDGLLPGSKHGRRGGGGIRRLKRALSHKLIAEDASDLKPGPNCHTATNAFFVGGNRSDSIRTLQQYHGGPNVERTEFMEEHSALSPKQLSVAVEQVSIFLTADNTVVSFFESSGDDVEMPIVSRLRTPDTILRRCSDASMVVQAILDAIIDLAIPVTAAYQDAIDELELNVLTDPAIEHAKKLYILQSEISQFRANVSPVKNLIVALREHHNEPAPNAAALAGSTTTSTPPKRSLAPTTAVTIAPWTYIYLGDVEDHIVLITESIDQMRKSADNMISLIFNTIGARQNESMKQLTLVTILFLPLSFLTGYFGMNFVYFDAVHLHSDAFFWATGLPVVFVVLCWLMRDKVVRWVVKTRQRRGIVRRRKARTEREMKGKIQ